MMLDTLDYMVSNVWRDMRSSSSDEEIRVSANINVILTWHKTELVNIICGYHSRRCLPGVKALGLPNKAGIYVIYKGNIAHYVGIATDSLKKRFRPRLRFVRELGFDRNDVNKFSNRLIYWATIDARRRGGGNIIRVNKKTRTRTMLKHAPGTLLALEQHLIKKLNTLRRGNRASEAVFFSKQGKLNVTNIGVNIPTPIANAFKDPIKTDFRPK